jgi:hypothetical protein
MPARVIYLIIKLKYYMNFEQLYKIILLVLSGIATWKIVVELLRGRQSKFREEYKFAKDFFEHISSEPNLHPFLKQKGYQAVAGDANLTVPEVEYLLTLQDSSRALKDFVFGRKYLVHFSTAAEAQIRFKTKYEKRWKIQAYKLYYFGQYAVLYFAAVSPLFFHNIAVYLQSRTLTVLAISCLVFLPISFYSLVAGLRISRAQSLVNSQTVSRGSSYIKLLKS